MNVNSAEALKTFKEAINVLKGKKPVCHSECEFCAWADDNLKFE